MKIPLICLLTGFGLAHVTSFITRDATAHEVAATAAYAGVATPQNQLAFSQYDVALPQTVAFAATDAQQQDGTATPIASQTDVPLVIASSSTLTAAPVDIAANVSRGVGQMNEALKTAPVAIARMTDSVSKNGIIAALAYDDPAVKEQTNKPSAQLGDSLHNFAKAIGKDMQRTVRESGIQAQSVAAR